MNRPVLLWAAAAVGVGLIAAEAFAADVTFHARLLGQIDPVAGDDRYGDVWAEGGFAYLGSFGASGVRIIDISDPTNPTLAATYGAGAGGQFKDVKVHNGIGYFASDNGGGLHIVDLTDPASPTLLAQVTSAEGGFDSIHNVSFDGGFLYQADGRTTTVKVFDVSVPSSPQFVRDIQSTDTNLVHDVTALGGRLYTSGFGDSSSTGTTDIFDVADVADGGWSEATRLLGTVATGRNNHSNWASASGDLLAVARETGNGDVTLWDISDPAGPLLLSAIDRDDLGLTATTPHNPVIVDDRLYISWYQAGLQVLDISDPSNPLHLAAFDTFPGPAEQPSDFDGNWGVYPFLGPDLVLLSDMDGGLLLVSTIPAPGTLALLALGGAALAAGAGRGRGRRRCGMPLPALRHGYGRA